MFEHHAEIQDIIKRVEEAGGAPVDLVPDPTLSVLATASAGNFTRGRHILRYRPNVPYVEYHVAHQSALLLRRLLLPPARRADLTRSAKALQQVTKEVAQGITAALRTNPAALTTFAQQVTDGLLRQLASVPVGMRVDEWLLTEYPTLHDQQLGSMELQQKDNLSVLSERVRSVTPPKVFEASVAMNAAYAVFACRMGIADQFVVPYEAVSVLKIGEHLISIYDDVPTGASFDQQLIDKWGHALKLSTWYEWRSIQETEIH